MTRWVQPQRETAPPYSLGEGLLSIPAKLVTEIRKGKYVNMAELLHDNNNIMEAGCRRARLDTSNGNRSEVPDLFSWVQYFGTYAAVVAAQFPPPKKKQTAVGLSNHDCQRSQALWRKRLAGQCFNV